LLGLSQPAAVPTEPVVQWLLLESKMLNKRLIASAAVDVVEDGKHWITGGPFTTGSFSCSRDWWRR
jgi:hypothetical protein